MCLSRSSQKSRLNEVCGEDEIKSERDHKETSARGGSIGYATRKQIDNRKYTQEVQLEGVYEDCDKLLGLAQVRNVVQSGWNGDAEDFRQCLGFPGCSVEKYFATEGRRRDGDDPDSYFPDHCPVAVAQKDRGPMISLTVAAARVRVRRSTREQGGPVPQFPLRQVPPSGEVLPLRCIRDFLPVSSLLFWRFWWWSLVG